MTFPDDTRPPEELRTAEVAGGHSEPSRIGPYRILQTLGEGGMGVVYDAEQEEPVRRRVALKVIKLGLDTREVVRRFESERQALAVMDHPAIARVYDGGTTDHGRPYFAMELVHGTPITAYCKRNRLDLRSRLKLFIRVCQGVQHAHQKGIIHRDIKPSNILVHDQDDEHVPKIIDFGVAKATAKRLTERTVFTEMGQLIGTPEYMSPEQAEMSGHDVDTRTDVYCLGVLLYEMLTGELPFPASDLKKVGFNEYRRRVLEDEPPRPSSRVSTAGRAVAASAHARRSQRTGLARLLRGDLDWIVMKALEKDRTRRYASASELAHDVERYLGNRAVAAGPPGGIYRMRKFTRRHVAGVLFAAVLFVLLAGFAVAMTVQLRRTEAERDRANQATESTERATEFLIGLFRAPEGEEWQDGISARRILDGGEASIRDALRDDPNTLGTVLYNMALAYGGLGINTKARDLMEEALGKQLATIGENDIRVTRTMDTLAGLLSGTPDGNERAREYYQRSLDIRRRLLPENDPLIASAMNNLSNQLYLFSGDKETARLLREQACDIWGRQDPPDPRSMAKCAHNEATKLLLEGRYAEARKGYEAALEIKRQLRGQPGIALTLEKLADVCEFQGDPAQARSHLDEALAILEADKGRSHSTIAPVLVHLASVRMQQGAVSDAGELLIRAISIAKENDSLQDPQFLFQRARYAALAGNVDDALDFLRKATRARAVQRQVLLADPALRALRGNPEFDAVTDAVGG